jgi:hypothetical protein
MSTPCSCGRRPEPAIALELRPVTTAPLHGVQIDVDYVFVKRQ